MGNYGGKKINEICSKGCGSSKGRSYRTQGRRDKDRRNSRNQGDRAQAEQPKKAPAKKTAARATKEAPVEEVPKATKAAAKKAEPKATAKKAVESVLHVQYAGRSYSQEDLLKIAKDVWKYDLKRKVGELESVEMYVKPEENKVYYVMNGEVSGCFDI